MHSNILNRHMVYISFPLRVYPPNQRPLPLTLPAYLRKIKENNASAVFSENISNPRLVEQIAREAGLNVAGVLYTDALSEPGGPASTYLEMMEHNVTAIATAASNSRNTQP